MTLSQLETRARVSAHLHLFLQPCALWVSTHIQNLNYKKAVKSSDTSRSPAHISLLSCFLRSHQTSEHSYTHIIVY